VTDRSVDKFFLDRIGNYTTSHGLEYVSDGDCFGGCFEGCFGGCFGFASQWHPSQWHYSWQPH